MDKQFERINKILGKNCERNNKNALKFLVYLENAVETPCHLTGIEAFPWEEPYLSGGWDKLEYQEFINDNPSFMDQFQLIALLPQNAEKDDIKAKVRRLSDQKIFEIELSRLECTDFNNENYQMINDYTVWYANFNIFS